MLCPAPIDVLRVVPAAAQGQGLSDNDVEATLDIDDEDLGEEGLPPGAAELGVGRLFAASPPYAWISARP